MKSRSWGIRTRSSCSRVAKKLDLKLIFVGDPMQHGSVGRGNFMRLLKEHGRHQAVPPHRNPPPERRRDYRAAAQLLSEGKTAEGFDALDKLGWVREIGHGQRPLHAYGGRLRAGRWTTAWNGTTCWWSPRRTARPGIITGEIRSQLRDAGKLGEDEREFTRLVQVEASEAERGPGVDLPAGDVIQFHQNGKGGFVKGQRIVVTDPAEVPVAEAAKFAALPHGNHRAWPRAT